MKSNLEMVELLKAAVVVAAADGVISSSERGLLTGLAVRVGVGRASLDAMITRAMNDPAVRHEIFTRVLSDGELALEILVAAARLDGEISDEERDVLVHLMDKLQIPVDRFSEIYERGIKRADSLRKAKFG